MKAVNGPLGLIMIFEVDETEALAPALLISLNDGGGDVTELLEELGEFLEGGLGVEVLDVDVGELSTDLVELGLALL